MPSGGRRSPYERAVDLQIAGHTVTITSPDKVFFQTRGETKLDLVNYYLAVGEP